jgi:GNAT superfamily N-acetyltransferase
MTSIRRAVHGDADAIAELLGQLGYPGSGDAVVRRMRNIDKSDNTILVATGHDGRIVGLAGLHRMGVLHLDAPVGYITAFVIDQSARGRGVGRMLLAAAEQWARDAGCIRLTVTSAEPRADAHAFYPACGLPYTGRRYAKALT